MMMNQIIRKTFQNGSKISILKRSMALTMDMTGLDQKIAQKIAFKDAAIRIDYEALHLPTTTEKDAKSPLELLAEDEIHMDENEEMVRRKRLIYRAKQRGWLEADILLGSWASKYVPTLTPEELLQFEVILQEETIDIFRLVSKQDPLPDYLNAMPVMHKLIQYTEESRVIDPVSYAEIKKETNLT